MTSEQDLRKLLGILYLHRRELEAAGADKGLLEAYASVLSHIRRRGVAEVHAAQPKLRGQRPTQLPLPREEEIAALSIDEVEKIANDDKSPRKLLEMIASVRFHVPRGSMRSYSNIQMLREKILTSARNERAHTTIGLVARQPRS